jgi:predicted ester cyclase
MMRSAFPDMNISIDDMFATDDKVVTRFAMTGTFTGEMMGIPPTGKSISVSGIVVTRWEGGKEVEAWESMDTLAFYQQLGISPPGG